MGKLTLAIQSTTAGSDDEAYHEALFDAHGPGTYPRAGDPELFSVSLAGANAGEQWRLVELAVCGAVGAGDRARQASGKDLGGKAA